MKRKIKRTNGQLLTLYDAQEEYLEEKKALNKSPATLKNMAVSFDKWVKYLESKDFSLEASKVDSSYIFSFSNHYLNEEMKTTTLNHYLRDIRAFCYWCMEKGYIPERFPIRMATQQQHIKETYTDEEILALIKRPSKNDSFSDWRSWAIINFILATGQRASTVCELRMGDINFFKGEIQIRKTKTNKASIIPLSKALNVALKEYIRLWRSDANDDYFLFPNVGEELLTVNALRHSIVRYNASRDVKRTSVHALRHTFAKNWIRNTGDVFRLQKMLGHSTLEMTRQYVNMFDEDLKEDFEAFNPLDRIKKNASRTQTVKRNED